MSKNIDGFVDSKIDEKLKKIMEKRNIHNDAIIQKNDEDHDIYEDAARSIVDYITSTGYKFEITDSEMSLFYDEFRNKFEPDKLMSLDPEVALKYIFYSTDSTNDSLCYYLEFHQQIREGCGSIAGGSSYKFGLFQRKEDGLWITGSPNSPVELDIKGAIDKSFEIIEILKQGAEIIRNSALTTVADYENLDTDLYLKIGKYASSAWVHKYFHMLYPDKLSTWHSSEWQKHILYAFGIEPNEKYYARSGQLAKIFNLANLSAKEFAHASYDWFGGIKQFCRLGTSDEEKNYFNDWTVKNIAAIGWRDTTSIETYKSGSDINKKALTERMLKYYYGTDNRTASRKAGELITYYNTNKDSVFVAMDGERLLALGDNIGNYYYDAESNMAHCKSIDWHICFNNEDKLPQKNEGLLTSCTTFSNHENLIYLYHKYYHELGNLTENSIERRKNMNPEIVERVARSKKIHALNQIVYGAPGTGKTYSSVEYAIAIIEGREINNNLLSEEERRLLMTTYSQYMKSNQITFTTFHQSYGYEEFIQGVRPETLSGNISFKIADGVFKTISDKALDDHENNYVIIIDEINRGNISKIFGELITLIEDDKRWGELNQMSVTLPSGARFAVPNNLYIIGTMNSADKSISLIDTALRRRFDFIEMAPNPETISDEKLKTCLKNLNHYLKKELRSTDLLIGHSYFIGKNMDDLVNILNKNIIPLLYEYFYDDEAKVKKAIDCIEESDLAIDEFSLGRIKVKRRSANG